MSVTPTPDAHVVLNAIASPLRLLILRTLLLQPMTVNELHQSISFVSPSYVSKNLKALREAGLVSFIKAGVVHTYRVNANALNDVAEFISDIANGAVSDGLSVGDIITTQAQAERLPLKTIVLSEDEDGETIALQYFGRDGNYGNDAWLETGCEYHRGTGRGLSDYLPAKIIFLPSVAKQDGAA